MIAIIAIVVILLLILLGVAVHLSLDRNTVYQTLQGKHVVVTGGSSGIGSSAALEAVRLGATVTIIGRDLQKLQSAVESIMKTTKNNDCKIFTATLDVTSGYDGVEKTLSTIEKERGPIFMLVNCAGACVCGQFENVKVEDVKWMIDLNFYGTAYPTKYVLPGMKKRKEGIVVFVASEAALLGIYGYSSYSASKWAIRGLAEALFMELIGTGVSLTLAFPPDTDTPGYETEQLSKPNETKLISGSGGLHDPVIVGQQIIQDAMKRKSYSVCGFSGHMMSLVYCGSIQSVTQVLTQVVTMGLLRGVMTGFLLYFYKIVRDGLKEKKAKESVKDK